MRPTVVGRRRQRGGEAATIPITIALSTSSPAICSFVLTQLLEHLAYDRGLCPVPVADGRERVRVALEAVAACTQGGRRRRQSPLLKRASRFLAAWETCSALVTPPPLPAEKAASSSGGAGSPQSLSSTATQWALVIGPSAARPREVVTVAFVDAAHQPLSLAVIASTHAGSPGADSSASASLQWRRVLLSLLVASDSVPTWGQSPLVGKGILLMKAPSVPAPDSGCVTKPALELNAKHRAPQVDIKLVLQSKRMGAAAGMASLECTTTCWHQGGRPLKPITKIA
ncbi:hypothetical protein FOA52_012862 [Chlamydomonas sp. UWO 241]|nr:hypothetical protein FOA52_012862 [Chlamydomonas sp. UWO 241]